MRLLIPVAAAVAIAIGVLAVWSSVDDEPQPPPPSASGKSAISVAEEAQATASRHVESRVDPLPSDTDGFVTRAREVAVMPPDADREKALRSLAQEWAAADPTAAERWAAALTDSSERERALSHVCLTICETSPAEAASIAQWHRIDKGVVEAIASRWAESDFDAAVAWADAFSDAELRDRVLARLVLARAGTAPAEAAAIVSNSLEPGQAQQEAAIAVLHQWLLKDAEAARKWVDVFPEGPLKDRAIAEIQGTMSYRNQRPVE
jgi:hypothetical protein